MSTKITPELLISALGIKCAPAEKWAAPIQEALIEFGIDTDQRVAFFLAQAAHESMNFRFVRELWGPTPAQFKYEGRKDLGNTHKGDGYRFLGRGLIQITGRANYTELSDALGIDFISHPELLERPENAARSAGWFWKRHGLSKYADAGDFRGLTRAINGGLNGLSDRQKKLARIMGAMGL